MTSSLKSWRELLASPLPEPLLEGQDDDFQGNAPDKSDKRTNPDLLRVDLSETAFGQIPESSDKSPVEDTQTESSLEVKPFTPEIGRSRLVQTGPNTWKEAEWCRGLCVNCEEPLAPGDVIACTWHRAQIDALTWESVR
jgi:hypothetical protein